MLLNKREDMARALNSENRVVFLYNLDEHSYRAGSSCRVERRPGQRSYMEAHLSMDYDKEGDSILYISHPADILIGDMCVGDWVDRAKAQTLPILSPGDKIAVLYYSEEKKLVFVRTLSASNSFNTDCSVITILVDEAREGKTPEYEALLAAVCIPLWREREV